jgi:hypothetical protein
MGVADRFNLPLKVVIGPYSSIDEAIFLVQIEQEVAEDRASAQIDHDDEKNVEAGLCRSKPDQTDCTRLDRRNARR